MIVILYNVQFLRGDIESLLKQISVTSILKGLFIEYFKVNIKHTYLTVLISKSRLTTNYNNFLKRKLYSYNNNIIIIL